MILEGSIRAFVYQSRQITIPSLKIVGFTSLGTYSGHSFSVICNTGSLSKQNKYFGIKNRGLTNEIQFRSLLGFTGSFSSFTDLF